jgi:hypothetical protein
MEVIFHESVVLAASKSKRNSAKQAQVNTEESARAFGSFKKFLALINSVKLTEGLTFSKFIKILSTCSKLCNAGCEPISRVENVYRFAMPTDESAKPFHIQLERYFVNALGAKVFESLGLTNITPKRMRIGNSRAVTKYFGCEKFDIAAAYFKGKDGNLVMWVKRIPRTKSNAKAE